MRTCTERCPRAARAVSVPGRAPQLMVPGAVGARRAIFHAAESAMTGVASLVWRARWLAVAVAIPSARGAGDAGDDSPSRQPRWSAECGGVSARRLQRELIVAPSRESWAALPAIFGDRDRGTEAA